MKVNFEISEASVMRFSQINDKAQLEEIKLLAKGLDFIRSSKEDSKQNKQLDGTSVVMYDLVLHLNISPSGFKDLFKNAQYIALRASIQSKFPELTVQFPINEEEISIECELQEKRTTLLGTKQYLHQNRQYYLRNQAGFHMSNASLIKTLEKEEVELERQISELEQKLQRRRQPESNAQSRSREHLGAAHAIIQEEIRMAREEASILFGFK